MIVGRNFIVDKREASPKLQNGQEEHVTWYQFRIPVREFERRVGAINDFTSIRFMRMFLTNFQETYRYSHGKSQPCAWRLACI